MINLGSIPLVTVLIILSCLVIADKVVTVANISLVEKSFPKVDRYSIERNPLARYFFVKLGLTLGTLVYGVLSLATLILAYFAILSTPMRSYALYIICLIYSLVIGNNLYFMLKYARIIP